MSGKPRRPIEEIEEKAMRGEDVTQHFTEMGGRPGYEELRRKGKPLESPSLRIQKVNIDLGEVMLGELDNLAETLNISRQAVIKMMLRQGLDNHFLAREAKRKIESESA
jgi:hypothetical protein